MKVIHLLYDDLPDTLITPAELRHKRVEVVLMEVESAERLRGLKDWIASMPDVGDDSIFARQTDAGREDVRWDT
jgi:hypothetical protein